MPYIGKSPHFGVRNRFIYTASAGNTSKSGADDNGATLIFTDGAYVDVYLNGALLNPDTAYVTTTANTIGSISAMSDDDILEVIVYDVFSVSDTVSAASGGTFNSDVNVKGDFDVISEATSGYHPTLKIDRQQSDTAANNDPLGQLEFSGRNDAAEQVNYFRMRGKIKDASDGTEDAQMAFKIMTAGSLTDRIVLEGGQPMEFKGGDIDISDGDIVFSTAGKGINLGVTSNTDANTLDDYEEGTYTVALTCGTSGSVALKSTNNTGRYTKIGRICHVNCDARIDSVSSPSGSMVFSLPFASANPASDEHATLGTMITHGTTKQSGQVGNFFPIVNINAASFTLQYENASTRLAVTHDNVGIGANDEFVFTLTYTTA